jgi:4-diphosphocytidyl-2-C-methyl-D-erythritol kinase
MVAARAPAKVNLRLAVGARSADGFHPLATVFQAVALWETVVATRRDDDEITVTMDVQPTIHVPEGAVPLDGENLAVRAAKAVVERYDAVGGVDLRIVKGVPVAGGMAGGSADAAAALVAASEVWGTGATRSELAEIAATLGSDVPFALHGHTAIGRGRGDELAPALARGEFHWVFATRAEGLSTAAVYAEFDRAVEAGERLVVTPVLDDDLMMGLRAGDASMVGASLANDLQDAALALAPELAETLDVAREAGALGAMVSGSGPTVAALGRSRQHALAIAAAISAADVADAVLVASGPAGGAAVVAVEEP